MFFTNEPNIRMPFIIEQIVEIGKDQNVLNVLKDQCKNIFVGGYVLTKNSPETELDKNVHEVLWQKVLDDNGETYREIAKIGAEYYIDQLPKYIESTNTISNTYNAAIGALSNTQNYVLNEVDVNIAKDDASKAKTIANGANTAVINLEARLQAIENKASETNISINKYEWQTF